MSRTIISIISGIAIISLPNYLKIMNEIMSKGPRSGPSEFFNYIAKIINQLSQMDYLPFLFYILGGLCIIIGILNFNKCHPQNNKE